MKNKHGSVIFHQKQVISEVVGQPDFDASNSFNAPCIEGFRELDALASHLRDLRKILVYAVPQRARLPYNIPPKMCLAHKAAHVHHDQEPCGEVDYFFAVLYASLLLNWVEPLFSPCDNFLVCQITSEQLRDIQHKATVLGLILYPKLMRQVASLN